MFYSCRVETSSFYLMHYKNKSIWDEKVRKKTQYLIQADWLNHGINMTIANANSFVYV